MTFLTNEVFETLAIQQLAITDDTLSVDLSDGRTISVPLAWYPRLLHGSIEERNDYRLIAGGSGIHWNQLDEDISTKNLILGQPSGESQKSLKRWLNNRVRCRRHCVAARRSCRVRSLMWLLLLHRSIFGERTMHIY